MTPTTQSESNAKPRCRLNALRLGLTGQVYVLTEEEAPRFQKHYAAILKHYQPVGPIETSLVDQIAHGIWRMQRAQSIEEGIFALDSAPDAPDSVPGPTRSWLTLDKAFDLLGKYERRIQRSLDRAKSELAALQSERKHQTALDVDRAVALHRLAKAEGKPYDPSLFQTPPLTPESVFSPELVAAESARREVQHQAQQRILQMQKHPKAA